MKILFYTFILCAGLSSCNTSVIYSEEKIVPDMWKYADTIHFAFDIQDTIPAFDIMLNVSHSSDFSSGNMYVLIHTKFPDGHHVEYPVSLNLADQRGQWLGKCNNEVCNTLLQLSGKVFFNQTGQYVIGIRQHSRKESVTGIKALELIVQRHKS